MIGLTTLALACFALPSALAQKTYTVQVGAGGKIAYDPESISGVNPGDAIDFTFNPKNHTVTQSSFNFPCQAVDNAIRSGFVPVAAGASPVTKRLIVPASAAQGPLWFYCGQTGHCGQGMVFAINPPTTGNTFEAFKAKAIAQNGAPTTFTTPAPPAFSTVTAVVSDGASTWTSTYTSYVGSPSPSPAADPVDHKITVGANGQLAFSPANITANIGDTVTFEFHPKNHTVTQSSFANPCSRLSAADGTSGFASGFKPVASDDGDLPTFQIKINDTAPIWGYCGQTGHCQQGMVFAINAIESGPNNFATFQQLATQSGGAGNDPGAGFSGSASTTGSATGPASPNNTGNTGGALGKGVNVALTLGVSAFALMFAL